MLDKLKHFTFDKALPAIILSLIAILVIRFILSLYDKLSKKAKLDVMLNKILRLAIKGILLFVAVIVVLGSLGVSVSSLVATLSVVGVAVSLAIQGFLSNVFGGIQIVSNHPFEVGDYVEVADQCGTVREVGLFYTKLDTPDKKLVQIPNSLIANSSIVNYNSAEKRRVDITVCTSYDNDAEQVMEILQQLLAMHPLTLDEEGRQPVVHITGYNEYSITYSARAWCKDDDYWSVYFDIMDVIKPTFDKAGIKLGYPGVTLQMKEK